MMVKTKNFGQLLFIFRAKTSFDYLRLTNISG